MFNFRTFIGDPIPYDPTLTPEQLSEKVWTKSKLSVQCEECEFIVALSTALLKTSIRFNTRMLKYG